MASAYPGALDSFSTSRSDTTAAATTHAADHNDANDAINKIEAELGTNPSLASSSVAVLTQGMVNRWIPIFQSHVNLSAAGTGTYWGHQAVTEDTNAGSYASVIQYLDPADYALTGFTVQCRVIAGFMQNATANAGTTVMTAGLYPVTPAGGTTTFVPTAGTVVSGSTAAQTGGSASSDNKVISSTFTMPAADSYMLGVAVATATTAGGTRINLRLEYRHN